MSCVPSRTAPVRSAITEPGTYLNVAPRWLAMYGLAWRKKSTNLAVRGRGRSARFQLDRVEVERVLGVVGGVYGPVDDFVVADADPAAVAAAAFARGRGRGASRRSSSDAAGGAVARARDGQPRASGDAGRARAAARSRTPPGSGRAAASGRESARQRRHGHAGRVRADMRAGGHARLSVPSTRFVGSSVAREKPDLTARRAPRPTRRTNIRASSLSWLLSKRLRAGVTTRPVSRPATRAHS